MTVRLVSHLLKVDLGALARERVGSLHGRISRSVEGFVKFLRVTFSDFVPAVLMASFAVVTGIYQEWRVGLVMLCVIPVSILITVLAGQIAKRNSAGAFACERRTGRHRRRATRRP